MAERKSTPPEWLRLAQALGAREQATERQRRRRARGVQVSATLTDPAAAAEWLRLVAQHGTQRAALEALLSRDHFQNRAVGV